MIFKNTYQVPEPPTGTSMDGILGYLRDALDTWLIWEGNPSFEPPITQALKLVTTDAPAVDNQALAYAAQCISFIIRIGVAENVSLDYWAVTLYSQLLHRDNWRSLLAAEDGDYYLAGALLSCHEDNQPAVNLTNRLLEVVREWTGIQLHAQDYKHQRTLPDLFFGPAWTALYGDELRDFALVSNTALLLHHRPPFALPSLQVEPTIAYTVKLPDSIV